MKDIWLGRASSKGKGLCFPLIRSVGEGGSGVSSGASGDRGATGMGWWWRPLTGSMQRLDLAMENREKGKWGGRVERKDNPH